MSASSEKPGARRYRHPMLIAKLFLLCGVFTVLPLADLPFIGLSITAPLMLPIFYYAFLAPAQPWRQQYRSWLWVASGVWVALGISFLANGSWLTNRTMDYEEFASLWRYLYWLLVFGATAWVPPTSRFNGNSPKCWLSASSSSPSSVVLRGLLWER